MLISRSASIGDLARLQAAWPKLYWKGVVVQVARSLAYAIEDAGEGEDSAELLAIVGLYPAAPDLSELWLLVAPHVRGTKRAGAVLRELVRLGRLHLDDQAVAASVKAGHAPGARLARLVGFDAAGDLGGTTRFLRTPRPVPPLTPGTAA